MAFVHMHVSSPPTRDHSDLVFTALSVEAPGAAEQSLSDPSHADADDGTDHIVWLAHELSQCDHGDWLDTDGDALEWCVLPVSPTLFPQSPTSVEWSSNSQSDTSVHMSDAEHCGPRSLRYDQDGYKTESSDDGLAVKLESLAIAAAARDQRLNVTMNDEEDIKVQLAHPKWVGGDMRQELNRRRQRGYERKYRKKRHSNYKSMLEVWAMKEIELHTLMQERARPWRVDAPTPSYEQLCQEELAARVDRMHLQSLAKWQAIFQIRNDSEAKVLRNHEAWAALDWSLLGASITKPFRPFCHTFDW